MFRSDGAATRLDPLGTILLTAASALLIYPLVQGREHGRAPWTSGMMAALRDGLRPCSSVNERRSAGPGHRALTLFRHPRLVGGYWAFLCSRSSWR